MKITDALKRLQCHKFSMKAKNKANVLTQLKLLGFMVVFYTKTYSRHTLCK